MIQYTDVVIDELSQSPIEGAEVFVYNTPDNDGDPASLATLYASDGVTPVAQPLKTNNLGVYSFYQNAGEFTGDVYVGARLRYRSRLFVGGGYSGAAQAAAEAAKAAGGVGEFANTAAGLAGTEIGQTFWVDNGDGTGTTYRHDAGPVATEIGKFIKDPTDPGAANLLAGGVPTTAALALPSGGELVVTPVGPVSNQMLADKTAIAALTPSNGDKARIANDGEWLFDSSDLSIEVTIDTNEGLYVAPTSDATGASGAWVRAAVNGRVYLEWFDASGGTDYQAAWEAAKQLAASVNASIYLLAKTYPFTGNVVLDKSVCVRGEAGLTLLSIDGGSFRVDAQAAAANITGVRICDFDVERTGTAYDEYTSTSVASDTFTVAGHNLATGWEIVPQSSDNGLTSGQIYYVIRVDANSFKLASSLVNADAGTAVALSGTTNMTFRFYEVGAFEVIGDDTSSPQYALIRSKIDNISVAGSTGNGFCFRGGGYQYEMGRIATVQATRRPLFVDTGVGGNTAWNGIEIGHMELRNGAQGRTSAVSYTERDSMLRSLRNVTIGTLIVQGGAGIVFGKGCQAVHVLNIYTELARSPTHDVDIVIGETGRAQPVGIKFGLQRYSDGTDSIGRSGKDYAIKTIRCVQAEIGNGSTDGYGTGVINNAYDSQGLVTGEFGRFNGAQACNKANYYFRPRTDHYFLEASWAGATVNAGTTTSAAFTFTDSRVTAGDMIIPAVTGSNTGLMFNPRTAAGNAYLDVTAHGSADVTVGGRTARIKVTPLAFIDPGTDVAWT